MENKIYLDIHRLIALMKKYLLLILLSACHSLQAQVVGGQRAFEFLRLSPSPHISALGGISIISPTKDVMMSMANPALLRPEFHTNLGLNYNAYYADTKVMNLFYAHHAPSINTTFGFGIHYLKYGTFTLTDALGNVNGDGHAVDYAIQLNASKSYLERWRFGTALKLANSQLLTKKSSAILFDFGLAYADTNSQWYFGAAIKNAGIALKKYDPNEAQPMPLDLQLGITKKFKKAPFSFMMLGHHLYQWDVRYDNPADQVSNQLLFSDTTTSTKTKKYFADKFFRHIVFALDVNLGKRLEFSVGYNHLRRSELAISERKGMSGFSLGGGLYANKFTIHYAQSYYHIAGPYHELGINFRMHDIVGFGKGGTKINWAEKYASSYK